MLVCCLTCRWSPPSPGHPGTPSLPDSLCHITMQFTDWAFSSTPIPCPLLCRACTVQAVAQLQAGDIDRRAALLSSSAAVAYLLPPAWPAAASDAVSALCLTGMATPLLLREMDTVLFRLDGHLGTPDESFLRPYLQTTECALSMHMRGYGRHSCCRRCSPSALRGSSQPSARR